MTSYLDLMMVGALCKVLVIAKVPHYYFCTSVLPLQRTNYFICPKAVLGLTQILTKRKIKDHSLSFLVSQKWLNKEK